MKTMTKALVLLTLILTLVACGESGDSGPTTYEVGDRGPANGWIFYVNPDAATDGWTYLEVAHVDQSSTTIWSSNTTLLIGTSDAIGDGYENTDAIVTALGTSEEYAARLCWELELNGYDDWFLPSINEMNEIRDALAFIDLGDFNNPDTDYYWTSSEYDEENAFTTKITNISSNFTQKDYTTDETATRAVRRF